MSTTSLANQGKQELRVNKWLEGGSFNGFHWTVFILCFFLMTMDGYDLYVYASAIPLLMKGFGMGAAQAGAIASAASIGTLLGALVFGPIADKIGRKNMIIATTVVMAGAMIGAGTSHTITAFAVARFVFGLGNGAQVPSIMALSSEFVPVRNRATMISCISCGASSGALCGALMGIWAFPHYGWRPVFFFAALPILVLPFALIWLPEATTYLFRKNRLDELKKYLRKSRPGDTLPDDAILVVDKGHNKVPLKEVFQERRALSTVLLWICYGVNLYVMYGFSFWLPKLMMNHGFSLSSSLSFLVTLSLASIVGSFIVGRFADRFGARPVLFVLYLLAFASVAMVGFTSNYGLLMVLVSLAGAGFNGAQNTINGYIPSYYPPSMRSTAMSYNFGFGRLGGIIGPTAIGALISLHFSYEATLIALAVPSVISAIAIACVRQKYSYAQLTKAN